MTEKRSSSSSDSGAWSESPLPAAAAAAVKKDDKDVQYEYFQCEKPRNADEKDEYSKCDIIAIGAPNVGKTSILVRFKRRTFDKKRVSTIGVDYFETHLLTNHPKYDRKSSVIMFDSAGQERYATMSASYMRRAHGAIIVFDSTTPGSLKDARQWLARLREVNEDAVCVLVANKCDLYASGVDGAGKPISKWMNDSDMQAEAVKMGCQAGFFKCSALDGGGIDHAVIKLVDLTLNKLEREEAAVMHEDSRRTERGHTVKLVNRSQINASKTTNVKCCSK